MASLLPNAKQQFCDLNGTPVASGTVAFYIPGTTTLKTVWADAGETIPLLNPVALDMGGYAVIYGRGVYRQVLQDANGNQIWDVLTSGSLNDDLSGDMGLDQNTYLAIWRTGRRRVAYTVSGTFTVPPGIFRLRAILVGGGGGGGSTDVTPSSPLTVVCVAAGGNGAGYCEGAISVVPGQVLPVTVGAGGTGIIGGSYAQNGTSSTIGALTACYGLAAPNAAANAFPFTQIASRPQLTSSGGDINGGERAGGPGVALGTNNVAGGIGGQGQWGGGGGGGAGYSGGFPGFAPGGGGGGAAAGPGSPARLGGSGAGGIVIVEY